MPAIGIGLPRQRLRWALLASLLLHLLAAGNVALLRWPLDDAPTRLDVSLAASPAPPARPASPRPEPRRSDPPPSPVPAPSEDPVPPAQEAAAPAPPLAAANPIPAEPPPESGSTSTLLPTQGELRYRLYWGKSRWLAGQAVHHWRIDNGYYRLSSTVRTTGLFALLRPFEMIESAQGQLIGDKLRPLQFSTQFNGQTPNLAMFNWEKGSYRWFGAKGSFTQPLPARAYDKISFLYQLALARERKDMFPAQITLGWHLEAFAIEDMGLEEVDIEGTPHIATHLRRTAVADGAADIDIWLSATRSLPIKMVYASRSGDRFEQLIAADSIPGEEDSAWK